MSKRRLVSRAQGLLAQWAVSPSGLSRKRVRKLLRHTLPGGALAQFHPGSATVYRGGKLGRQVRGFSKLMPVGRRFSDMKAATRDLWQARITERTPALDLQRFHEAHSLAGYGVDPALFGEEMEVLVDVRKVRVHGRLRNRAWWGQDRPHVISLRSRGRRPGGPSNVGKSSVMVRAHLRKGKTVHQHVRHLSATSRNLLKTFRSHKKIVGVKHARTFVKLRVADWRRMR